MELLVENEGWEPAINLPEGWLMKKGKDGDPLSAVYLFYKPFFVQFNNKQSAVSALKRQDVTKKYLLQLINMLILGVETKKKLV